MEIYVNVVQDHGWCYQLFYTLHVLNKRFGFIFTKKRKGKTKLEYMWVEINPELVLTKLIRRHKRVRKKKTKPLYNKYMVWGQTIMLVIIVWKVRVKWKNRSVKHKGQNKHKANIQGGVIGMLIEKNKFMSKASGKSRKSVKLHTLVLHSVEETEYRRAYNSKSIKSENNEASLIQKLFNGNKGLNLAWRNLWKNYEDAKETPNFRNINYLGRGNFGEVFRCDIPKLDKVGAAKVQKNQSKEARLEFLTEITKLHAGKHPNVISLLGKWFHQDNNINVYGFIPRGSLDHHLFQNTRPRRSRGRGILHEYKVLSWRMRFRIAVGVAKSLDYLHEEVHRDVKVSNVLLDKKFVLKLTGFGLATVERSGKETSIGDLVVGPKQLDANVEFTVGTSCPPVFVNTNGGLPGGKVNLSGSISSRYLTTLRMAPLLFVGDVEIEIIDKLIFAPYVKITLKLIECFGVSAKHSDSWDHFFVKVGQKYKTPSNAYVEGDASSASYFFGGAAITGGTVTFERCGTISLQGNVKYDELVESYDDGDEEQVWSQPQLKRSTRVSVRPENLNVCLHITDTKCEWFLMVINEESWIEACKKPSLYQENNLLVVLVDDLRAAKALQTEANWYHQIAEEKLKEVEKRKRKDYLTQRFTSLKPGCLIFSVKPRSSASIIFCSFYMAARGESGIHDGDDVDWSLFTVYGENYSQAQELNNKIVGPPIYRVYDDDDQIEYGVNDGQVQDNDYEVVFHVEEDVQLEQTKDVYGEEVANNINLDFEIICGKCLLAIVPLKSRVTFSFLQRSQFLSYIICGDFMKIFEIAKNFDTRKVLCRDMQRSKESGGIATKIYAEVLRYQLLEKVMVVIELTRLMARAWHENIFYIDGSSILRCSSKHETVELSLCEADNMAKTEAVKLILYHFVREYVEHDLIEVHCMLESEQRVDTLTEALRRLKFKEMRGLVDIEDFSKMDFKLKGENVGLSLKEKET